MTPVPVPATPSRSQLSIAAICATLSAALFACGGGGDASGEGQQAAPSASAEVPVVEPQASRPPQPDPTRPQVAFTDRSRPPAAEVRVYLDEREPEDHGWTTEVLQEVGREALESFLEALLAGPGPRTEAFLSEGFKTAALRPAGLELAFEDDATNVKRAAQPDTTRSSDDEARKALADLHALFAGATQLRAEVEIVVSELAGEGRFVNEALIVLSGVKGQERVQVSCTWRVQWIERADDSPLIEDIAVLAHEEVSMPKALFGDLTVYALGSNAFFRSEFMLGVDDYYYKMDQLAGAAFIGSQGLAVGDANGDGRDDIFVAQQGGIPNRLFLQRPDGKGEEIALVSGVGFLDSIRSALFIDLDNDGDQDLALALGPNVLVVTNNGSGVFGDPVVLDGGGTNNVFSMCAADPDNDGDLDIYACHYILNGGRVSTLPAPYYDANNGSPNNFWRNEGGGVFTNATVEVGLDVNNRRFSLGAIWEDFDLDGDVDLYVTNDFGRNNLYRNDGGKFVDIAEEAGASDMAAGMGATVADYDRDGDMDVYISNMFMAEGMRIVSHSDQFREGQNQEVHPHYQRISRGNTLLSNRGDGTFEDVTMEAGVWRGGWAWGATFGDFNNDGWSDIYVPNGFVTGWSEDDVDSFHWRSVTSRAPLDGNMTDAYSLSWAALEYMVMQNGASWSGQERNRVYLNTADGRFADIGAASGVDLLEDSRAVGMLDWNDDGRLDIAMKNRTAPRVRLLLNQNASGGDFLAVQLEGVTCNRDAIGARVALELEGTTLLRTLHAGEGYIAQSSKRLHFGLGKGQNVESLTVHWPDGTSDRHEGLAVNERYRIVQGAEKAELIPARTVKGMGAKTTAPIEQPETAVVDRVVLVERLPLGPFRMPSYKNPDRTVADFEGFPVLFDVWASYGEDCHTELKRFKRRRAELEAANVYIVPLTIEDPVDSEGAKGLLEDAGILQLAGYLDKKAQLPLEVVLSELLGRSSTTPLPTSFLVDERGYLAVVYLGPVRVPQLLSDVAALRAAGPEDITGEYLLGGKWLSPRKRDMTRMVNALGMLGERELGKHFFEFERSR